MFLSFLHDPSAPTSPGFDYLFLAIVNSMRIKWPPTKRADQSIYALCMHEGRQAGRQANYTSLVPIIILQHQPRYMSCHAQERASMRVLLRRNFELENYPNFMGNSSSRSHFIIVNFSSSPPARRNTWKWMCVRLELPRKRATRRLSMAGF